MEPIKMTIDVNVHLSEKTENFILNLVKSITSSAAKAPEAKAPEAKAPEAKAPEAKAPEAKAPEAKAPDAKAPEAKAPDAKVPEEAKQDTIDIDTLRTLLASKAATHRPEIKAKLTEFGTPSLTKMDPAHYNEMYNFLNTLD